ncbi:MAG: hypothetical protein E6Q68_04460 [Polynucleobacter sp.]|nr:MAG: hypothetical protein E6Q68_04460 [Polynucleobacter sp.]
MSDEIIKKEDLFNVIKHGQAWYNDKIKEELEKIIAKSNFADEHYFRWDSDDKYNFIYDNECYLFVYEGRIEVRCDRDNVFSSFKTIEFPIKNLDDIQSAYDCFKSMTMEDEEE